MEEKSFNTVVNETAKETGHSVVKICKYENALDECLQGLSCPNCHFMATSNFWRKLFKYPRGKIIKQKMNYVKCSNCGFEYSVLITLDIDRIKEKEE